MTARFFFRRYMLPNAVIFGNTMANFLGMVYVSTLPWYPGVAKAMAGPTAQWLDLWFSPLATLVGITIFVIYEQSIRRVLKDLVLGRDTPPAVLARARSRVLNQPYFAAAANLALWLLAAVIFAAALKTDGAPEWVARMVVARSVLTGLIISAASFFVLEHITQHQLAPWLFPEGGLVATKGALRIRIRTRLVALVVAVAVVPFVGVLLSIRGARMAVAMGLMPPGEMFTSLTEFLVVMAVYALATAAVLTIFVDLNLTRPLKEIMRVVKGVRRGDFNGRAQVMSNDEIGYTGEAINQMTEGLAERELIKETFGKYVAKEVRDEILAGRVTLDGEMKEVTLLFSDLRDFTPMVEATEPKQVVEVINRYFGEMTAAIAENHGLVLQYVGDEIEAVFGAPVAREGHQQNAARAALAMRARLAALNEKFQAEGLPTLRHGLGVHTGQVLAASIGSPERLSYALVGDGVNLASRISDLTKHFKTDILVSQATAQALGRDFKLKPLPKVTVKGKSQKVTVFELLG